MTTVQDIISGKTTAQEVKESTGREVGRLNLPDRAVLVRVNFGRLGVNRKVSPGQVEVRDDEGSLKLHKRLCMSPQLSALDRFDSAVKVWVYSRVLKPGTFGQGLYFLGNDLAESFEIQMRKFREARDILVQDLVINWDDIVQNDRKRLSNIPVGGTNEDGTPKLVCLFDERDYPAREQVASKFAFTWQYLAVVPPKSLQAVSEELYEQAKAQIQLDIADASDSIRVALRQEMAELVDWSIERLTPGQDGRKKILRANMMDKVGEFLEVFSGRNLTDDKDLQSLVDKAKALTKGVDVGSIKTSEDLRDSLRVGFEEIKETLDSWLEPSGIRQIDLD